MLPKTHPPGPRRRGHEPESAAAAGRRCWPTTDPLEHRVPRSAWWRVVRTSTSARCYEKMVARAGSSPACSWVDDPAQAGPCCRAMRLVRGASTPDAVADLQAERRRVARPHGRTRAGRCAQRAAQDRGRRSSTPRADGRPLRRATVRRAEARLEPPSRFLTTNALHRARCPERHAVAQVPESKALVSIGKKRRLGLRRPDDDDALRQACGLVNDHLGGDTRRCDERSVLGSSRTSRVPCPMAPQAGPVAQPGADRVAVLVSRGGRRRAHRRAVEAQRRPCARRRSRRRARGRATPRTRTPAATSLIGPAGTPASPSRRDPVGGRARRRRRPRARSPSSSRCSRRAVFVAKRSSAASSGRPMHLAQAREEARRCRRRARTSPSAASNVS